jgi:hypothetical protein
VFKRTFLAHTNEFSKISLKGPNHVVTCENKNKIFFSLPGKEEKIKGRLFGNPVTQNSISF